MSVSEKELEGFFAEYAQALSGRDIEAIARHWNVPALVLSDQGAIPVATLDEVKAFFGSSMGQYEGIATARATIKLAVPLSDAVAACRIAWTHLDSSGKTVGGEAGYYMLKRDGGALRIHVYTPLVAG